MRILDEFKHEPRIAYFSMEIALENSIPTYAGGLGVLAGDTLRSAADLEVPLVAVTLASRGGYFRQVLDESGRQIEQEDSWDPQRFTERLGAIVSVEIENRWVWVGAWCYIVKGHMNGAQPVILLDTDLDQNNPEDRNITRYLYGGDEAYRLKQEIVLGIGGVRMLEALGFQLRKFHMNEGHSALLGVELLRRHAYPREDLRPGESPYNFPRVRDLCSFTTHTPVEAGHDRFPYDMVGRILGNVIDYETLKRLGGEDVLNMTRLALNLSEFVNGVAMRHAEVSRQMFPGYRINAITNGVHPFTWACRHFRALYDAHLPGWCHEPALLRRAHCYISDEAVVQAHRNAKRELVERVRMQTGVELREDVFTLGYARRMTAYKRPDLLFSDIERLRAISKRFPVQIVLSGKAHPRDEPGKQLIQRLHAHARELAADVTMAYLPNYDLDTALAMVSGVDVWLNTPLRPLEASGTSGMKAAFNGVPQFSTLDGWWLEGWIEGVTGWAIGGDGEQANGKDLQSLYEKLENVILPLFYENRSGWIAVMKGAITMNASYFDSHRMMRRYTTETYLR